MKKEELQGYFELNSFVVDSEKRFTSNELFEAMDLSQVKTFGWPIGIVLHPNKDYKPYPTPEGLVANVKTEESYDFWRITHNGELYSISSLFEDRRKPGKMFFDTRIIRATEAFMRIGKLYTQLGFENSDEVAIRLELGGMGNRILSVANSNRVMPPIDRVCKYDGTYSKEFIRSLESLSEINELKTLV